MRKHGWPEALHDYIVAAELKEFAYGAFDCCLFSADWVLEATGVDYAAKLRGYSSMRDAYEIVAQYGSLEAMVTYLLGSDPIHPSRAQRGDIMLWRDDPAKTTTPEGLGICLGLSAAFPNVRGLKRVRTLDCAGVWKI